MNNKFYAAALLVSATMLLSFSYIGKPEWDYTANCGGYADKGIVNVEITGYWDDQKTLDDYLKKCAVHAVIFRGLAPSKENGCPLQQPIEKNMFAEEESKKFFKKFFEDKGPYTSFVSVVKDNKGSELFYKGQGYKKTMVFSVQKDRLAEAIRNR